MGHCDKSRRFDSERYARSCRIFECEVSDVRRRPLSDLRHERQYDAGRSGCDVECDFVGGRIWEHHGSAWKCVGCCGRRESNNDLGPTRNGFGAYAREYHGEPGHGLAVGGSDPAVHGHGEWRVGNTAVSWTLSPNVGTISSTGLYTAPATLTTQQSGGDGDQRGGYHQVGQRERHPAGWSERGGEARPRPRCRPVRPSSSRPR